MLDWLLNPYGIDLGAYIVLWLAMLIIIPVSIVVGIVQMVREHRRTRREGPSGQDGDRARDPMSS